MALSDHKQLIDDARAATFLAREVRARHRRASKMDDPARMRDIALARTAIQDAMRPIRSEMGRAIFDPATARVERSRNRLRSASLDLQAERRKLWKLGNVSS